MFLILFLESSYPGYTQKVKAPSYWKKKSECVNFRFNYTQAKSKNHWIVKKKQCNCFKLNWILSDAYSYSLDVCKQVIWILHELCKMQYWWLVARLQSSWVCLMRCSWRRGERRVANTSHLCVIQRQAIAAATSSSPSGL